MKSIKYLFVLMAVVGLSLLSFDALAQCPMCRSAVETAMQNEGNNTGAGLNDGIIYLLSIPYLAVLVVGGLWYYRRKKA